MLVKNIAIKKSNLLSLAGPFSDQNPAMFEILYQYLIQQRSLSLPGLGTLHLQNIPAMSDFSNHIIGPPSEKVVFDSSLDAPHKNLFLYVAKRRNIAEWEAIKLVNDFSFDLKHKLKDGKEINWEGIGILRTGDSGEILLEARPMEYEFLRPAPAIRVVRHNTHHIIRRGDKEVQETFAKSPGFEEDASIISNRRRKWWLWAVLILTIGLLMLIIHFSQTGFSSSAIQNQQKPDVKEAPSTYTVLQ